MISAVFDDIKVWKCYRELRPAFTAVEITELQKLKMCDTV